ncbi:PREDICTED: coiled-coil domain-containing protein 137 isoform X2 [Miniopterus natalensis]|uniref:coiled-coil domain-containing protein 137 isoform X2 n=1 Tax=Miniopterus natalensis TaxID=291302 RepID=UPI0007A6F602|nr:PREDICTED: coiled-coil domain-containing protein 137 isoform X2 [Miniopterus natalensis]
MGISDPFQPLKLGCSLLSLVCPSCGLGRGMTVAASLAPPTPSCLSHCLPLSSAQAAFRKTLEKEARGVGPDIAVPKFKQRKWESDGAYIQRMEQEVQHVLFLTKNQPDQQPEAQVAPRKKSEGKKAFQKRRLDKVRKKREDKAAERLEQELLRDTVKFGEVALQPPELTAKPRKSVSMGQVSSGGVLPCLSLVSVVLTGLNPWTRLFVIFPLPEPVPHLLPLVLSLARNH